MFKLTRTLRDSGLILGAICGAAMIALAAQSQPMRGAELAGGPSPSDLGIEFVDNSTTSLIVERGGKRYLVDVAARTIREADPQAPPATALAREQGTSSPRLAANSQQGAAIFKQKCSACHGADGRGVQSLKAPDFTSAAVQASLSDQQMMDIIKNGKPGTLMAGWSGKLPEQDIQAVAGFVRSLANSKSGRAAPAAEAAQAKIYTPGDDFLFSLPTGRPAERHGFYVNFTHRFVYTPAFSGPALGGSLFGLDDFSLSSFGFRYGVTDKFSVSIYRSPTFIARPIQLMAAYNFLDERRKQPLNAAVRVSIEGENNFSRNFTENLEGVFSRSLGSRAQLYAVPTLSLNAHRLFQPNSFFSSAIPNLPGYNTFSIGAGGAFDIRPTVAIVAEVIPTLVNGRPLEIHRPPYAIGIQKKIWRHAFTFGFSTGPGTTVSQRAGTRAAFLNDPAADKPGGLFVGFDLTRQIF